MSSPQINPDPVSISAECPKCGLNWLIAVDMLSDPPGSDNHSLAIATLGRCTRVCRTYPLYLGIPPLKTIQLN